MISSKPKRDPLDFVDLLGPDASVDARGQLERVLGPRLPDLLDGNLDVRSFGNLRALDWLENSVFEDCLDRGFHRVTAFRSP